MDPTDPSVQMMIQALSGSGPTPAQDQSQQGMGLAGPLNSFAGGGISPSQLQQGMNSPANTQLLEQMQRFNQLMNQPRGFSSGPIQGAF